ncbi:MAG: response regulator [Hydrogenophilales bacterium]|nr:response regulator [Hydrogenophilales bacterium]
MERTLLLVDDEQNILSALGRLFRRDGYRIFTANGGREGLALLAENKVGVILSDQRMPEMSGSEFLSQVTTLYPDTVRIMLSGYTDLASVTDAINRGAIYKLLTKPWEDELLRDNVRQAFEHYEMAFENERLKRELTEANARLAVTNQGLERQVEETSLESAQQVTVLNVAHEVLDALPIGVLGVGDEGMVAVANRVASGVLEAMSPAPLVGAFASARLPREMLDCLEQAGHTG